MTDFKFYLDFSNCEYREDAVKEVERAIRVYTSFYVASDEEDAEEWLRRNLDEDCEIYHNDDSVKSPFGDIFVREYFFDPGSEEYAYVVR